MEEREDRFASPRALLYSALVLFVLAWILGPAAIRSAVPIWLPFLVALGLELSFLVGAVRQSSARHRPDRMPQVVDRERYGYVAEEDGEEAEGTWLVSAPRRSGLRRFLTGLGIIGALALVVWIVEGRTGWGSLARDVRATAETRFSEEASRIAGKPVSIRCDDSRDLVGVVQDADGVARVGGSVAYLTPERCYDLYRLAYRGDVTSSRTARAIAVLAHEAWHLRGVRDEGETECYALQSGVELGQRLGLSRETAQQMMRQQLAENALRAGGSSVYRVPSDCRDDGRLDLRPGDSRFP